MNEMKEQYPEKYIMQVGSEKGKMAPFLLRGCDCFLTHHSPPERFKTELLFQQNEWLIPKPLVFQSLSVTCMLSFLLLPNFVALHNTLTRSICPS